MTTETFQLGQLVSTPGALQVLEEAGQAPSHFLGRHTKGDWGEMSDEDKSANDRAVVLGGERIFSAYAVKTGEKIWIITEADRSSTTILLPAEY